MIKLDTDGHSDIIEIVTLRPTLVFIQLSTTELELTTGELEFS